MILKALDLLRELGWGFISLIFNLIDAIYEIISKINELDIVGTMANNTIFSSFYTNIVVIAISVFGLFTIWQFAKKAIDPEEGPNFTQIVKEVIKCGILILVSTFLFVQVSNFSITLSNYTGNIFETNSNSKMSDSMLTMFISYRDGYKNSDKFNESKSISELVNNGSFDSDELYLSKYVTKSRVILSDEKDYKYEINWIMAVISGGFFLYSLFFAGIMLGRRQIEFLFLFSIAPIVFATSVCNKQRRGAVIEQLVSLALQSAVVMLIVSLTVMVMQEINVTKFFDNTFMNITTKSLLYLGCATFIMTGSQVINRFIGSNVSAASGREQLMSLMGYGKMAGIGATLGAGATLGGALLGTGLAMKGGKAVGSHALSQAGIALGTMGTVDPASGQTPNRMQRFASAMGSRMYATGQKMGGKSTGNKFSASDAFMNAGASSLHNTVRRVMPRASYNTSYYRRRNMI